MDATFINVYIAIVRYLMVALVGILLFRTVKPLLTFRREPEIWAWLCLDDGTRLPITHWESVIGANRHSDIVIRDNPKVSMNHAVLTRYDDGSWTISEAAAVIFLWMIPIFPKVMRCLPAMMTAAGQLALFTEPENCG